jgi:hypothetical protein
MFRPSLERPCKPDVLAGDFGTVRCPDCRTSAQSLPTSRFRFLDSLLDGHGKGGVLE